jgi:predicted O-linked N-acetylglucosamine transferase (SPINDLY family)
VETLSLTYQPSRWTETALEPLLRRLGWQYAPWYSLKKAEKKAQKKGISPTFTQVLPESSTQFFSQVSSQAVSQVFPNISPKFSPQFSFQLPPQSSAIETGSKSPSPLKIWLKQAKEHLKTEDLDGALHCYQQALALSPQHGAIHCNLGCLWQQQGKRTEAVAAYQRAIEYQPDLWTAYQNLVGLYLHEGDLVSALDLVRSALNHHPQAAPLHLLLGDIYRQRGDLTLALNAYREAIRCDDRCVSAYQNLGGTLMMVNNTTGAKICFKKALDIQPGIAGIYRNLGEIYEAEGDYLKAQECFLYTLSLDPDQLDALIKLEHLRLTLCDWEQYESRMTQMLNRLETADSTPIVPLTLNCFPVPPALHRQINEQWSRGIMHRMAGLKTNLNFQFPSEQPQKIKIGYLSADFRQHAVGSLIAPLFQYHDRSRFEVYAYSLSATTDELTEQVQQGCDHFQNIAALGTEEAARLIHQDGIHILIDLGGYTNLCRPEILALQPAPIQMQYIGYPDTMGAEFVPYILADRWIIPDRLENYYTESLVALPHTFVTAPIVLPQPPTREELGLPETGVVYACFNRTDKFSPDLFARWMQILQQVPDSVLWLVEVTPDTTERLYQTAKGYGIEKERLVFLKKRSWVEFMSVCQQADLFLDSFIYNAGATAVCAIQAGVPILTCPGETFASRMGASICHAADLESFVCQTPEDYQTQGIYWGQHPDELRSVQQCLRTQKANLPLFQPQAWMQALETQLFALAIVSEGKIS